MTMRKTAWAMLAGASMLAAVPAGAAERGFYVGGFYGQTRSDLDQSQYENLAWLLYRDLEFDPLTRISSSLDDKDSGYGFFGGFRFSPYLAVEGGYVDLGKFTFKDQTEGFDAFEAEDVMLEQRLTTKMSGLSVSVLGILPLTYRTELFARGGVIFTSNELTARVEASNGFGIGGELSSESDTDFLAGVGAAMSFAEIYSVRLEYQRIFDAGDEFTGEADTDIISLGVAVTF